MDESAPFKRQGWPGVGTLGPGPPHLAVRFVSPTSPDSNGWLFFLVWFQLVVPLLTVTELCSFCDNATSRTFALLCIRLCASVEVRLHSPPRNQAEYPRVLCLSQMVRVYNCTRGSYIWRIWAQSYDDIDGSLVTLPHSSLPGLCRGPR